MIRIPRPSRAASTGLRVFAVWDGQSTRFPRSRTARLLGSHQPPRSGCRTAPDWSFPEIRDAERLQGFEADWTLPSVEIGLRKGVRWRLVGNAVSVPVSRWVGNRLAKPGAYEEHAAVPVVSRWPSAAWGSQGHAFGIDLSHWPMRSPKPHLQEFLQYEPLPLSSRATEGFLNRTSRSSLRFPDGFLDDVRAHLEKVRSLTRSQLALL